MPTEDDLRVAFRDMERFTPDAADVLRAVYDRPRRSARWRHLPPLVPRRPALRAALALGAAGAVAAGAVIAAVAVAQGPATPRPSLRLRCGPTCWRPWRPPAATSCTHPHRARR